MYDGPAERATAARRLARVRLRGFETSRYCRSDTVVVREFVSKNETYALQLWAAEFFGSRARSLQSVGGYQKGHGTQWDNNRTVGGSQAAIGQYGFVPSRVGQHRIDGWTRCISIASF